MLIPDIAKYPIFLRCVYTEEAKFVLPVGRVQNRYGVTVCNANDLAREFICIHGQSEKKGNGYN